MLAEQTVDPEGKRAYAHRAETLQLRWGCPCNPRSKRRDLSADPELSECLKAVATLTGFEGATTCPNWYLRQPWVLRAAMARRWRDKGALQLYEGEDPSAALCEAIDLIDSAYDRRTNEEAKRLRAKHEKPDAG